MGDLVRIRRGTGARGPDEMGGLVARIVCKKQNAPPLNKQERRALHGGERGIRTLNQQIMILMLYR